MPANKRTAAPARTQQDTTAKASQPNVLVKGADWLLSRLPWFKYRYMDWSYPRRIAVGYLMWLVVLPVIPIGIMAIWYSRDPEGFKKSPLMPVLLAITAAWFGGAGWVFNQTPITDGTSYASVKDIADGETATSTDKPDAVPSDTSKAKVAAQKTSKSTGGRKFENCTAAFEAGVFDIKRNNQSYERRLDRDNDGIACER